MMISMMDPITEDELESKYLWYIDRASTYPAILIRIDLENWEISKYEDDFLVWWICNLPNNEFLLQCFHKDIGHYYVIVREDLTLTKIELDGNNFMHSGSLYHEGEIYTFWGKSSDANIKSSNKINIRTNRNQKLSTLQITLGKCSCIEFMGKIFIAWNQSETVHVYDEYIDSYSELSILLKKNRNKLLCKKDKILYLIDFPSRIFMTSSPFDGWELLYEEQLKILPTDFDHHIFYQGSIWLLSDKNIYKFDFDKTGLKTVGYFFESNKNSKVYLERQKPKKET